MDSTISRAEYDEHNRRMEDEHRRMNRRLEIVEEDVRAFQKIATSVEKLAIGVENMIEEQKRQGDQIGELKDRIDQKEKEPVNTWKRIRDKFVDTFAGLVAGGLIVGLVSMIANNM